MTVSLALLVRSTDEYGGERDAKPYTLLDRTFTRPERPPRPPGFRHDRHAA